MPILGQTWRQKFILVEALVEVLVGITEEGRGETTQMTILVVRRAIWLYFPCPLAGLCRLFLAVALFFVVIGQALGNSDANMGGNRGFSDPRYVVPMPNPWLRQPVRHPKEAQDAHLVLTLDRQIYAILLPIIQQYARKSGLNILVREGTCGNSANLLIRKQVDMAGYCCPPGASDRLPGLQFHTLGIAAIAVLVHPQNPVQNLTLSQVRDIFRGHYFLWSEVDKSSAKGHARQPIQTFGRLHCRLRPGHWRKLWDNPDLFSPRMGEVGTVEDMVHWVATHANAIGYETLWNVLRFQGKGRPKPLAMDGYMPQDDQALLSLRYPLYRVFSLAIWEGRGVEKISALRLVEYLTQVVASLDKKVGLISAPRLRQAGWLFQGTELVGEPTVTGR